MDKEMIEHGLVIRVLSTTGHVPPGPIVIPDARTEYLPRRCFFCCFVKWHWSLELSISWAASWWTFDQVASSGEPPKTAMILPCISMIGTGVLVMLSLIIDHRYIR